MDQSTHKFVIIMEQKTNQLKENNNPEIKEPTNTLEQSLCDKINLSNNCHICGYEYYHPDDSHSLCHMTLIIPHLYLGSKTNAQYLCELQYFNINTIINVACEIPKICNDKFKYIKYNWDDIFIFDILVDIDDIVDQIHTEITNENSVLVHCAKGISRSASVVIGYLMKYKKMSYNDAYKYVKTLRSCINPNSGFVDQLKIYGDKLSNTNNT